MKTIRHSVKDVSFTDIATGALMLAFGGAGIVYGYAFAKRGLNDFLYGLGFSVRSKV